jgi:hypothetical protein
MNEAAKLCGGKYTMVNGESNSAGGAVVPAGNGAVFVQGVHRTLVVSCH